MWCRDRDVGCGVRNVGQSWMASRGEASTRGWDVLRVLRYTWKRSIPEWMLALAALRCNGLLGVGPHVEVWLGTSESPSSRSSRGITGQSLLQLAP